MKTARQVFASLVTLLAVCCLPAADMKPIARVMALLDVETEDPTGYAMWLKEYNEIAKAKLNVDSYLRVFQTVFDGHESGRVRVAVSAANVTELMKNLTALENDPAIAVNRDHLRAIRKTGSRVLYQAVYFEGASTKGAHNFSTMAVLSDEGAYVKMLGELRGIFDANGLKDAKISAYRVLAGRTDHTHRITISLPSAERLGAFLDASATNAQLNDWIARAAKFRTVVSNTTAREISK